MKAIYIFRKLSITLILKRSHIMQAITGFWQGCQNNSVRETTVLSTNAAGTTGYLHAKEWIWTPTSY